MRSYRHRMNKFLLIKNFSWLFFDKILRIIGSLFVGIWVARYLGPHDFGIINYATAFIAFFMFLPNLGLNQIVVRELSQNPEQCNTIIGTAFALKLIGSLASVLLIFCTALFWFDNDPLSKTVILILSLTYLFQSFDVIDFYYQAKILSKYCVISRDISFILSLLIKIYLIKNDYTLIYFVYVNVTEVLLTSLLFISIYRFDKHLITQWKFDLLNAKVLMSYSWPLMLSGFLITIHTNIDQIMIEYYLDKTQVGIYAAALRLANCWLFIPSIIVSTLLPYYARLRIRNPNTYHIRLMALYSLMFWIGVIVSILTVFFGDYIILLLYGNAYSEAYSALVFNIWSGIFISQAVARGIWMISENLQWYRLYNNILAVFINVVGNFILIPKLGIYGAALATLLTQMLGTWLFPFLWKPLRKSNLELLCSINPIYMIKSYA